MINKINLILIQYGNTMMIDEVVYRTYFQERKEN